MNKFKRILAFICSLSIMSIAVGCGESKDENSESESIAEVTTTIKAEESTEKAAEESKSDSDQNTDSDSDSSGDYTLDMDGTLGTLKYKYSSDWTESAASNQMTYTFSDLSGAIMIQNHDAESIGSFSEDLTVEMLAEQSEAAWAAMDGMEIVSSEWVDGILEGDKKCYAVTYTYEISGLKTTNISYFFANFTDDSKELFAVTGSALKEDSNVVAAAKQILSEISFN